MGKIRDSFSRESFYTTVKKILEDSVTQNIYKTKRKKYPPYWSPKMKVNIRERSDVSFRKI